MEQTVESRENKIGKLRAARSKWLEAARHKNDQARQTHMQRIDDLLDELNATAPFEQAGGGCPAVE